MLGLPAALLGTLTVAARVPLCVGVNVTPIVQLLPAEMLSFEQVSFTRPKSDGFAPPIDIDPSWSDSAPAAAVLLTVIVCDVLMTPTGWVPKSIVVGASPIVAGDVAEPTAAVAVAATGESMLRTVELSVTVYVPAAA